jgi:carbon-monoxide dehydrogenase large subunit
MNRADPIGSPLPRSSAARFVSGKGQYTDDTSTPALAFVAFVRSPHARAHIKDINISAALACPGIYRVLTGRDIAEVCKPYRTQNQLFPELKSPLQRAVAVDAVNYQGEPIAMVIAATRALAEDAAALVEVEYEALPAVVDPGAALAGEPFIHDELGTNVCYHANVKTPDAEGSFQRAATVIEEELVFGRQTGVPLETRVIIADFDSAGRTLTVKQSHQVPHELQGLYARQLSLPESNVHVTCPDVGGAFGIKLQAYNDEIAVCAASIIAGRPLKYQCDRIEAFQTDVQARDHRVTGRIALDADGRILAFSVRDVFAIGPYPQFPRSSLLEGLHVLWLTGGPYKFREYIGALDVVFQNKVNVGLYRSVGQPVACAVTERLIDIAARAIGVDPIAFRLNNYLDKDDFSEKSPTGIQHTHVDIHRCHYALTNGMRVDELRDEQRRLRGQGVYRGIGFATFMELVNPGVGYYSNSGMFVSAQDSCEIHFEPGGSFRCAVSLTEFGQGTDFSIGQVIASSIGVPIEAVKVETGDGRATPFGGGSWASRGIMVGSEIGWRAGQKMRDSILAVAAQILQASPQELDIVAGQIVDSVGRARMSVEEIADVMHYRVALLPPDSCPEVTVVARHAPQQSGITGVGSQLSYVEVDVRTGFVRLLRHGVAHESGTIINPLLFAEQLKGGVAQGMGSALFEEILYDEQGQLLTGSLADYLLPIATDIPDIQVFQVAAEREASKPPKPKGVGEAGAAGASAAILNAINDAISPLGAKISQLPCTPERVLECIERAHGPT